MMTMRMMMVGTRVKMPIMMRLRRMMEGMRGCCKESLECLVRLLKVR
jgi:hypothetical protein